MDSPRPDRMAHQHPRADAHARSASDSLRSKPCSCWPALSSNVFPLQYARSGAIAVRGGAIIRLRYYSKVTGFARSAAVILEGAELATFFRELRYRNGAPGLLRLRSFLFPGDLH